jgi:hypothetical protein
LKIIQDKVYAKYKEFRELIRPEDCKFEINFVEHKNDLQIHLLKKDSSESIYLNSFLPSGFRFVRGEEFKCSQFQKEVHFRSEDVNRQGFLLALFHEIGHAHEKHRHRKRDIVAFSVQMMGLFLKNFKKIGKKEISAERLIPDWFYEKDRSIKIDSERDAWAYALHKMRDLNRKGYDVFSGFDTVDDIINFCHSALATYGFHDLRELLIRDPQDFISNLKKRKKFLR